MYIQKEENPRRYGVYFPKMNTQVICQLEPDSLEGPDRILIGEVKYSKRAKGALKILYAAPLEEYLERFAPKGFNTVAKADTTNAIERAFQVFIEERFDIKPELSK